MYELKEVTPSARRGGDTNMSHDYVGFPQMLQDVVADHAKHAEYRKGLVLRAPSPGVFAKLHVERPVAVVLDSPVLAHETKQSTWRHPARGGVGHEISKLAFFRSVVMASRLLDHKHLPQVGPTVVAVERGSAPEASTNFAA